MEQPLNHLLQISTRSKRPHYLRICRTGDTVGITNPAGYISLEAIQPAISLIEQWGFKIVVGATIGKREFTFGESDEERRRDLQQMLDNPAIKAVMCARGGYGLVRIIDELKWEGLRKSPKWIIGFSDVTVIHCHLNKQIGFASIHAKMCNSFPDVWKKLNPCKLIQSTQSGMR